MGSSILTACNGTPRQLDPARVRLLVLIFVAGITFHPAQAKEHPGPGGTDTAAGSGQRREDHAAQTARF